MRTIIVTGNLAADPEILTRADGSNYTKMRIGNHEYSDGKDGDTKWFTVFYDRTDGIVNALKKGSGIVVMGDYKDSLYEGRNGVNGIDRTVSATKIDFFSTAKREDGQQTTAPQQPQQPAPQSAPAPSAKAATNVTVQTPEPNVNPDVDDLPF